MTKVKVDSAESHLREERVQRTNQSIKVALEQSRKEQEKLLSQIKWLLADKENFKEALQAKELALEDERKAQQGMELKLSQESSQKAQLIDFVE